MFILILQVIYLPPNVTVLIQPMDQGVIGEFKKLYKKYLSLELTIQKCEGTLADALKKQTLKHCCDRIASAWDMVAPMNIENAWNKVLGAERSKVEPKDHILQMHFNLCRIPEHSDYTYEDVKQWVEEDARLNGWEFLSSEQILEQQVHTYSSHERYM